MKKLLILITIFEIVVFNTNVNAEFLVETLNRDDYFRNCNSINGNNLFYLNTLPPEHETIIFKYNMLTDERTEILCDNSRTMYTFDFDNDIIVWKDTEYNIYGYNVSSGEEFTVCNQPGERSGVTIDGNIVVWHDYRNHNYDIYGYNITTGEEFTICTNPSNQTIPSIYGDIVVWQDSRNGDYDVYGYNIRTNEEFPICTATGYQNNVKIYEDMVVWVDDRNGNPDIYGYNFVTGEESLIWDTNSEIVSQMLFYGNFIVWTETSYSNPMRTIYCYNLTTKEKYPAVTSEDNIYNTAISNSHFVYYNSNKETVNAFGLSEGNESFLAIEVSKNDTYYGKTTEATGGDMTSDGYNDNRDVWHKFTPTVSGDYDISLCGSNFDTTLAVFDTEMNEIAFNDDYCDVQSKLTLKAKAGVEYLIRIAGYDRASGNYVLNITSPTECVAKPIADISGDCKVDLADFAILASQWMTCGLENQEDCWR